MHSWFTQKLNEMIGLAHYCQYPILKAHIVLTQQAVDEVYNERASGDKAMHNILSLLVKQAEINEDAELAHHLRRAMYAGEKRVFDTQNVVELNFDGALRRQSRSGA